MRYCLDYPHAATVVVGMSKLRHVEQNVKVLGFRNDPDLLRKIEYSRRR
jgi:aryl-alcohol dehydrogenase-like predicted oxidoreductase